MKLAPTQKDVILRDGTAQLYHFRRPDDHRPAECEVPLLLVPSLINRWYVLDLREGASLVAHVSAHVDTFCLDWGAPEDEDRYLGWEAILKKLARAVRAVRRATGAEKVALLGYCMGGTLAAIHTALEPESIAALVNLAGPIDFSAAGTLAELVDPRWFDVAAIGAAGNVGPTQMQSGFTALQPMQQLAKWLFLPETLANEASREAFVALETWANDNTPFPAAAYETYIRSLYQQNELVKGEHRAFGRRVSLSAIRCPVLTIVASRDIICPPAAATALNRLAGTTDQEVLTIAGGHVGAVVGRRAATELYPRLTSWLIARGRQTPAREVLRSRGAEA